MNIIFFDQYCSLCRNAVKNIVKKDVHKRFFFAPLDGLTAKKKLIGNLAKLTQENTLILLENNKAWIRARAVLRIFWLLGGKWKWIGWLYCIPGLDFFYRIVAKHRHIFFSKEKGTLVQDSDRFLP